TFLYFAYFISDFNQCIAETIEFFFRLTFCWLNHQRAGHREGNGWCVEAVVHESFGNVFHFDAHFLETPAVDNHFVSTTTILARVKRTVMTLESALDVVRIQNCDACCLRQSFGTHHRNVSVRYRQYAGTAPRRCRHGVNRIVASGRHFRVTREERRERFADANRAHTRSATTMRNAKRLVQVEVANISADTCG